MSLDGMPNGISRKLIGLVHRYEIIRRKKI